MDRNKNERNIENEIHIRIAQYNALRSEIIERLKSNDQLLLLLFASMGTLSSIAAIQQKNALYLLLLLPLFISMIGVAMRRNSFRINQLGYYIKDKIEKPLKEKNVMPDDWVGWDTWQHDSERPGGEFYPTNVFARLGMKLHLMAIIIGLQIISIAIFYVFKGIPINKLEVSILIADVIIILYTLGMFKDFFAKNPLGEEK